jgi:hypothetical protein
MLDEPPSGQGSPAPENWTKIVGTVPPEVPALGGQVSQVDSPPIAIDRGEDSMRRETVADMKANRGLRETYADKAHCLAAGCISGWFVMLGCSGVVKAMTGKEMWSDKVMIAVTTGVTVSVLAAFLGVIRGLFPNNEKTSEKGKSAGSTGS